MDEIHSLRPSKKACALPCGYLPGLTIPILKSLKKIKKFSSEKERFVYEWGCLLRKLMPPKLPFQTTSF